MKFTLGFSPCPNDTFIFDALVNKKIDSEDIEFEAILEDVQTLNEWAKKGRLDISKISYGVLPLLLDYYILLNSGGALGKGVGPLLIAKQNVENQKSKIENRKEENNIDYSQHDQRSQIADQTSPISDLRSAIRDFSVAIPGENTTAHLLFSLAFPAAKNKKFKVFNEVEDAVINEAADAGVIIHESRFTYQDKGLIKLVDLGEYWEQETSLPIPLGGIVVKRTMESGLQKKVDRLIKKSLEYSFANYPVLSSYVTEHSQEMSEDVMRKHINLYVNNFSADLGSEGKKAVHKLLEIFGCDASENVFVEKD